jgi:radical SAM protein with 4Fe4S-binding SPASM domain
MSKNIDDYKFGNIGMEITSLCNSECRVCPRKEQYSQPVLNMDLDLFKKIMIDIHDNKIEEQVRFSGMGDASCDKYLIERLRFCKKRTPNLDLVVLSNMSGWKKTMSDCVINEGLLRKIRFSIFAVTEEFSEEEYGNKSQAGVARKAIEYFIEKNDMAGKPVDTLMYTLSTDKNKDELDRIKEVYWDAVDEFEVWSPHSWSNRMKELRPVQKSRRICPMVESFSASIRVNGDVCPCSLDINHDIVYGNLKDQTIMEVFNSDNYKKLRDMNRAGKIEENSLCHDCTYLNADQGDVLVELKDGSEDRRV